MTDWLVRTAQNRLIGPISEEQLKSRILAGEFRLEDEICRANDYWIFLHERDEVQSRLGIQVPSKRARVDDETETGTQTLTDTSTPRKPLAQQVAAATPQAPRTPVSPGHPPLPEENRSPVLALLLTLGGLGLVIFIVFFLRAAWLVR
jgi:hypothetical protein